MSLPFEILTLTFNHLAAKDLSQCQLVNKLWYQASVNRLYSNTSILTDEKAYLYARTIKSSSRFGNYLESIDTGDIFQKKEDGTWDTHGLLNAIVEHCPNILELKSTYPYSAFWTKLTYAAKQGQLSRLQYFASFDSDLDSYIYTALAFKKTLNTLELRDIDCYERNDLLDSEAYPILRKNLNRFSSLQNLHLTYRSGHRLSYYDELIEDCKHLKKVVIRPEYADDEGDIFRPEQVINQRPDIHTLKSRWDIIKADDQLNYIMQKFPNLKALKIDIDDYDADIIHRTSTAILIKFLRFAVNLQEVKLAMTLPQRECIDIWANFMNENYKSIDISITIMNLSANSNKVATDFYPSSLYLTFLSYTADTKLNFIKFLSETGRKIRSLTLGFLPGLTSDAPDMFNNIEIFIQVLQLCPSLEELQPGRVENLPFSENNTYQHTKLKSLSLSDYKKGSSTGIFRTMSFIFPNLKELSLTPITVKKGKSETTNIDMPNTSLNILNWGFSFRTIEDNDIFEVYIRLKTNSSERFYIAFENHLSPISAKQYNCPRSNIYLDITCQNLAKLKISTYSVSSNTFIYTF